MMINRVDTNHKSGICEAIGHCQSAESFGIPSEPPLSSLEMKNSFVIYLEIYIDRKKGGVAAALREMK